MSLLIEIRIDQAFLLLIAKLRYVTPTEQEVRTPEFYALMEYVRRNLTSQHARTTLVPHLPKVTQRVPGTNDPDYTAWSMVVDEKVDELLMRKFPLKMQKNGIAVAEAIEKRIWKDNGKEILPAISHDIQYTLSNGIMSAFTDSVICKIRDLVTEVAPYGAYARYIRDSSIP